MKAVWSLLCGLVLAGTAGAVRRAGEGVVWKLTHGAVFLVVHVVAAAAGAFHKRSILSVWKSAGQQIVDRTGDAVFGVR